ncbi:hypothetical protein [Brucella suis]|uniref:hypothetical protein n=1 Tax=Brucella suis TaxID=29461 RepID=UPI001AEC0827|nr:hypothetical protein [Brucella suis]
MRFAAIIHLYSLLRRHAFAEQGGGWLPALPGCEEDAPGWKPSLYLSGKKMQCKAEIALQTNHINVLMRNIIATPYPQRPPPFPVARQYDRDCEGASRCED